VAIPGFGTTHPGLQPLLDGLLPIAVHRAVWPLGELDVSAYAGTADLPDELISSVRCVVSVGSQILVCRTANGDINVVPGGRREAGESLAETAIREVLEETGCQLDPSSVEVLGFVHFTHLGPVPAEHPFPHPDFLQVVMRGQAASAPEGWVDTEGFVLSSWLVDEAELADLELSSLDRAFLALTET